MTKRTNRGRLPNPDHRGYVRPEVGGKRFIVGNIKDVGTAEMERRLADLRNLFERECQYHEIDHWAGSVLPHAKKLAAGERLVLRVSDYARTIDGQASEEAQYLHELRELGLDIVADDPLTIARGEKELKQLIDSTVREALAKASDLIADVLKPRHVRPPEIDAQFNYISDITAKWYRQFFYYTSTYTCPHPDALGPTFDQKFARIKYIGNDKFALYFMRYTGEWVGIHDAMSVAESMEAIQNDEWFVM